MPCTLSSRVPLFQTRKRTRAMYADVFVAKVHNTYLHSATNNLLQLCVPSRRHPRHVLILLSRRPVGINGAVHLRRLRTPFTLLRLARIILNGQSVLRSLQAFTLCQLGPSCRNRNLCGIRQAYTVILVSAIFVLGDADVLAGVRQFLHFAALASIDGSLGVVGLHVGFGGLVLVFFFCFFLFLSGFLYFTFLFLGRLGVLLFRFLLLKLLVGFCGGIFLAGALGHFFALAFAPFRRRLFLAALLFAFSLGVVIVVAVVTVVFGVRAARPEVVA